MLTIRDLGIQAPFTPAMFREAARRNESLYNELLALNPAGEDHSDRNRAQDAAQAATICAEWMEAQGMESAMHVGPFHGVMPKEGQRVRIKRGVLVRSTHPSFTEEGKLSGKEQIIVVDRVYPGRFDRRPAFVHQGEVHWIGTNGYQRWTNLSNVELIEEEALT